MKHLNKYLVLHFLILGATLMPCYTAHAQSIVSDSSSAPSDAHAPVYHVNFWVSVPIILVGAVGGITLVDRAKSDITDAQIAALNPNNVPIFDRLSLHLNPANVPRFDVYAQIGQIAGAAMPLALLIDGDIRPDWLDVMTMGLEANMVVLAIYSISPLGPSFQTRYRPLVYYPSDSLYGINRQDGNNKDSFYSGHVASVTVSAVFIAKVYCDYHPNANPYLVYGLAAIPSLTMGYIRLMTLDHFPSDVAVGLAVGSLCGYFIPDLHKIGGKNLSMGVYSSPTSTGLTFQWTPPAFATK
jgi:PAP2 superfamily